jgi:hypothetical protein
MLKHKPMVAKSLMKIAVGAIATGSLAFVSFTASASAAVINWTDWTNGSNTNGFTGQGTITTPTSTVNVTYNNPRGIAFFQSSGGVDYWQNGPWNGGRNPATSPYTSAFVENIPTGTDIVALRYAGNQTLTFSETVANPVFSYASLNVNGYAFDQDFEILSFGNPSNGNTCGYWGCGTSFKNVVDLGNGKKEYQLLGTGEPHGTLRFTGAFDTLSWRSLNNENWNGFTVGIEGTAKEVKVPEPMSVLGVIAAGGVGLFSTRKGRKFAKV